MTERKLADIYLEMFSKSRRIEQDLKRLAELDVELKSVRAKNDDPRIVDKNGLGPISTGDWIKRVDSLAVMDLRSGPTFVPLMPKDADVFIQRAIRLERDGTEIFEFLDSSQILRKNGEWRKYS